MKIVNPNCSEQVFKLTGTFEEIKEEIMNILYTIKEDWNKEQFKEKKKEISKIKTIEEFQNVIIPFSCNYETTFEVVDKETVLVATSNNYSWDDVSYIDTSKCYWDISRLRYVDIISLGKNWIIFKDIDYDEPNMSIYQPINKKINLKRLNINKDLVMVKFNKDNAIIVEGEIILRKVTDKKLIEMLIEKFILPEVL